MVYHLLKSIFVLAVLFYGFYATAQELDCENLETQILEAYNGSIEMKALGEEEKNDKKKFCYQQRKRWNG